jgi:hypothetical protein
MNKANLPFFTFKIEESLIPRSEQLSKTTVDFGHGTNNAIRKPDSETLALRHWHATGTGRHGHSNRRPGGPSESDSDRIGRPTARAICQRFPVDGGSRCPGRQHRGMCVPAAAAATGRRGSEGSWAGCLARRQGGRRGLPDSRPAHSPAARAAGGSRARPTLGSETGPVAPAEAVGALAGSCRFIPLGRRSRAAAPVPPA